MEKRRLGRTGHQSTVAIFGAVAFYETTPDIVDQVMEQVIRAGINHIDVAPGYGMAEDLLGPWMEKERQRFFLGCKTQLRTKDDAATELRRSLEKLRVERFDLFQLHSVNTMEDLDQVTRPDGALAAILEARDEGLTEYIGITGHGNDVSSVFLEALKRFDFDTVLFPINFVQYANLEYRRNTEKLLEVCRQRDIGSMIIKSVAKQPWGEQAKTYTTWYEPFDEIETIQQGVNFALSQDVSGLCTPGDVDILPIFLRACEAYTPMSIEQQEDLISQAGKFATIFDWENN